MQEFSNYGRAGIFILNPRLNWPEPGGLLFTETNFCRNRKIWPAHFFGELKFRRNKLGKKLAIFCRKNIFQKNLGKMVQVELFLLYIISGRKVVEFVVTIFHSSLIVCCFLIFFLVVPLLMCNLCQVWWRNSPINVSLVENSPIYVSLVEKFTNLRRLVEKFTNLRQVWLRNSPIYVVWWRTPQFT